MKRFALYFASFLVLVGLVLPIAGCANGQTPQQTVTTIDQEFQQWLPIVRAYVVAFVPPGKTQDKYLKALDDAKNKEQLILLLAQITADGFKPPPSPATQPTK